MIGMIQKIGDGYGPHITFVKPRMMTYCRPKGKLMRISDPNSGLRISAISMAIIIL